MLSLANILLIKGPPLGDLGHLQRHFCGRVVTDVDQVEAGHVVVYIAADMEQLLAEWTPHVSNRLLVVADLSCNFSLELNTRYSVISLGQVPLNMHDVGAFFPQFFVQPPSPTAGFYESIEKEHEFQALTQSSKPDKAFRRGIYLTPVQAVDGGLHFRLLRCSTNLSGPTDNFRETDRLVVSRVNEARRDLFPASSELNHVLAQTYHNSEDENGKQKKARISEHSDKTKDMPANGLLAFCTFYKGYGDPINAEFAGSNRVGFDYIYGKGSTILTKLRFRLKPDAAISHPGLVPEFDLTLYPNSLFIMSLWANRLYTHAIIPSSLPVARIPTRMGYVIRCSDTEALHANGETFVVRKSDGARVKLEEPSPQGVAELKELYKMENTTADVIDYTDKFFFSMNSGDYLCPLL